MWIPLPTEERVEAPDPYSQITGVRVGVSGPGNGIDYIANWLLLEGAHTPATGYETLGTLPLPPDVRLCLNLLPELDDDEEDERERQRTEIERNRAVGLLLGVKAAVNGGNTVMLHQVITDIDAFLRSTAE